MERKRQREIALVVLAVAFIAVLVWRGSSIRPDAAADIGPATPAGAAGQKRQTAGVSDVDLQALKADRPEPEANDRNPFRFKPKMLPPPPPPPPTATMPGDPALTAPAGPPPPPPIPLKFIGLASSKDDPKVGRMAILSDARGVYYGREGDVIEGRYRILKIGVESVDLAYLDGRGRQTIRQTGQ